MTWSFSKGRIFKQCPRKWFFSTIYADARSTDPQRHEAYLLSKLQSIYAWRGQIVDSALGNLVAADLNANRSPTLNWNDPRFGVWLVPVDGSGEPRKICHSLLFMASLYAFREYCLIARVIPEHFQTGPASSQSGHTIQQFGPMPLILTEVKRS